jgi:outer membrane protein, heavy metal efflux system
MQANAIHLISLLVPTLWLVCSSAACSTARAAELPVLPTNAPAASVSERPASGPSPGTAPATVLSIEALVAEVLEKNPELDFYRAEIAAAQANRKTAGQWANPEVATDLGGKHVSERGATLGDGMAWSVALAQTIEFPGRLSLRKAIANRQVDLARLGLEQFRAALAARARSLGYALLMTQEKAEAAREVRQRLESLLSVLVQREPAGVTPLLDQRIIEASSVTARRRASQAAREVQAVLLELNLLRGQPPATALKLTGALTLSTNLPSLGVLAEAAGTNNFDVRQRQVELAAQGFRVRLSKNERYPSVTLAPFYAVEKANDEQRIVGVSLTVPVPLWNNNAGNIEAAQARLQQAEASLRATWRQVERKVAEHSLALQSKLDEMAAWRANAPQQFREAAELADRHYRLGAVPLTTYLEMQTRYLDALEALLATQSEALEHRQQLELLVGLPLEAIARRQP